MSHRPFQNIQNQVQLDLGSRVSTGRLELMSVLSLLDLQVKIRTRLRRHEAWHDGQEHFYSSAHADLQQDYAWVQKVLQEKIAKNVQAFQQYKRENREYITPLYSDCAWAPKES